MNYQINSFLKKLGGGGDAFKEAHFESALADSDVLNIFNMQKNKDVKSLLGVWEEKCKKYSFELMHPESLIKTRAIYSVQYGMANFVFMADEEGDNIWLFAQCEFLINVAVTMNFVYKINYGNVNVITTHLKKLSSINLGNFNNESLGFGFLLSQVRPYHYFYDHLKFLLAFQDKKGINGKLSFFTPKNKELLSSSEKVFLFPSVVGNNYISQKNNLFVKSLNEHMENLVYREAVTGKNFVYKKSATDKRLILWFSITGQKRSWLEQVEGCANIVKTLRPYFESVVLYIDGMTAMQGERLNDEDDNVIFREIESVLTAVDGVDIHSLVGCDYREKIVCCDSVDFFIANAGTGCMIPLRFVKKPGVLHSNSKLFTFPDNYPSHVKSVHKNHVLDVANGVSDAAMHLSYHIPWQQIFNLSAEVLNETKGTEISKINVPPVADIKSVYDHEMQAQVDIGNYFLDLAGRIKLDPSSPSILREVAFSFEKSGDLDTAMKVMEKANFLRPQGPLIKRKLNEYRQLLAQQKS